MTEDIITCEGLAHFPGLSWNLFQNGPAYSHTGSRYTLQVVMGREYIRRCVSDNRCPDPPDNPDQACIHEQPLAYAIDWLESNGWDLVEWSGGLSNETVLLKLPGWPGADCR